MAKAKANAPAKKAAVEDSDDSDDEPAPKAKAKAKAKAADSDDDDEKTPLNKAGGKGESKGREGDEMTVFVNGLPFSTEEATLRKHFEECGEIERLNMPLNDEGNLQCPSKKHLLGNARGFAFITYKTKEGVEKALKFDGEEYSGRTLKVNKKG